MGVLMCPISGVCPGESGWSWYGAGVVGIITAVFRTFAAQQKRQKHMRMHGFRRYPQQGSIQEWEAGFLKIQMLQLLPLLVLLCCDVKDLVGGPKTDQGCHQINVDWQMTDGRLFCCDSSYAWEVLCVTDSMVWCVCACIGVRVVGRKHSLVDTEACGNQDQRGGPTIYPDS